MGILINNEHLVCKALTHPIKTVKIDLNLKEAVESVADSLCLRARDRRGIKDIFERNAGFRKSAVNACVLVKNIRRVPLAEV